MRAQHSCFGFEAPATDGLFFALFPDESAAAQLTRTAQQLCIRHRLDARPFAPERFHVSLLGFGAHAGLPPDLVAGVAEAAAAIAAAPFEVAFDRAVSFLGRPRPLVLCSEDDIPDLIAFQRSLGHAIQKRGLGRAKPQYTPHVTILYDERAIEDHAIEPVRWTVRDFVLVHSLRGKSRYDILGRWPLGDPLSLAS
ncbi:MAG: 2'-5' RNA ligase family protein [Xanthobacteraceae bacterium]